ncbi:hypothetical protein GA0070624_0147 [Micromonospora rhizosphaerae]|uniref:Small secreted domain n=1 Tax=Micromonospora rhizosphaerae TaxID=568872 RepID=A0A1C6R8R9_9ACTN|nr:hypothetical protein GA0070624_0147 [Micromonospora rhizosphaerae]
MRKLITGTVIAAAAVLVPAAPAFAIHDPNVPAGVCSAPGSQAVGHPATGKANTAFSNTVLEVRNNANPPCAKR